MKDLYMHPETARNLNTASSGDVTIESLLETMRLFTSEYMPKDVAYHVEPPKPIEWVSPVMYRPPLRCGILTPDGVLRSRHEFFWRMDRFTILDESDLQWLLALGILKEIKEMLPVFQRYGVSIKSPRPVFNNSIS